MLFSYNTQGTTQSTITSVDKKNNRSKHILSNPSRYTVYQYLLDGGIIKNSPQDIQKCDYIIEVDATNGNQVFLIELKGKDVTHALDQLAGTVRLFINPELCKEFQAVYQNTLDEYVIHLRVIATKIDKAKSILQPHERALLNIMKQLKNRYKIKFDPKEIIIRQAGNSKQVTDTI